MLINKTMKKSLSSYKPLSARPYQLMCIICRLGAGDPVTKLKDPRLDAIWQAIRRNPRVPVRLAAYAGDKFSGRDNDSPHGVLFHMYQDALLKPLLEKKPSSGMGLLLGAAALNQKEICRFDLKAAQAWRGCPWAGKKYFQRGRERLQKLRDELIPAFNATKPQAELDAIKARSAAEILKAGVIRLFPSHVLYVVNLAFQYECRRAAPVHHDNLWEPAEAMRLNPDIPVMLVPDHCMVCPPCKLYDMEGSGLCGIQPLRLKPSEKSTANQLGILRSLGLEYYQKIPARRLLKLAGERMKSDHQAFNYIGAPPSYAAFERTLADELGFLDVFKSPGAVIRRTETLLSDRRVKALLPADERGHVEKTLSVARRHLAAGNRSEAYLALTESVFAHTRKQYLELIPKGYARLPKTINTRSGTASAERVLKAQRLERGMAGEYVTAPSIPYSTGFVTMVNANRPAIAETGLKIGFDRQNLYVALVCADADVRQLKAEARLGPDLKDIGRKYVRTIDDAVLLVLHPGGKDGNVFIFTVNPKGVKLGEHEFSKDGHRIKEWICETAWSAAAKVHPAYWSVLMTIPWAAFGNRPARGAGWQMNAYRFFRNDMLDAHTWAPTSAWNIYDPAQCGRLAWA